MVPTSCRPKGHYNSHIKILAYLTICCLKALPIGTVSQSNHLLQYKEEDNYFPPSSYFCPSSLQLCPSCYKIDDLIRNISKFLRALFIALLQFCSFDNLITQKPQMIAPIPSPNCMHSMWFACKQCSSYCISGSFSLILNQHIGIFPLYVHAHPFLGPILFSWCSWHKASWAPPDP